MGFIKDALLGVAIYEGIKYYLGNNAVKDQPETIVLGGKRFAKTNAQQLPDATHRHHLDRPELIDEHGE